jgi:methionine sulfoxide reductase heme-binding subunit
MGMQTKWLHFTQAWISQSSISRAVVLKSLIALALSLPLVWLAWLVVVDIQEPGAGLGADAGERLVHYLGEWALIMLLTAYSVSPLRRITGSRAVARSRRMVGLFAFAYVCLHMLSYLTFYLGFSWAALLEDVFERPYITVGMLALLALSIMALTSTRGWQRRLGRGWGRLHKLIYPVLALALVHLWWLTRDGYTQVVLFSLWFVLISIERLYKSAWFIRLRSALQ